MRPRAPAISTSSTTNRRRARRAAFGSIELDPSNPSIIYAASYARGVWRSTDDGANWTQIKPSLNPAIIQTRPAISRQQAANGKTRMYVYEGHTGQPAATSTASRLFRSDSVATGAPAFTDLTSPDPAQPGFATFNLCGAQCWYDVFVYTPKGHPDMVYAGGSYSYGENIANKRGVVLSTDAGVSSTDMTFDGTDSLHPNGLHPDQHDIAATRTTRTGSSRRTTAASCGRTASSSTARPGAVTRPGALNPVQKARCEQMLSRIPSGSRASTTG